MKFVLIPDSFKGTLSSVQICKITAEKIREHFPDSEITEIPVADGGEGSVDAFLFALGGEKVNVKVKIWTVILDCLTKGKRQSWKWRPAQGCHW